MSRTRDHIIWFEDIRLSDVPLVGGKNAALGEMYSHLSKLQIRVPNGFAITAEAYRHFLSKTGLDAQITKELAGLNVKNLRSLQTTARNVRKLIVDADLPEDLVADISRDYAKLEQHYGKKVAVAIRSSATAEDLPDASFAGQQETFLHVRGIAQVLKSVKKCIASLFTDRAISYRIDKGFSHMDVALSVGVQKMVRSDLACSGVAFTLDTETGFRNVVEINGSYGLGEAIVQGEVTPDEFIVFKPTLAKGYEAILSRRLGKKNFQLVYSSRGIKPATVSAELQRQFCLKDAEILELARWCVVIEEHFSKLKHHPQPMDIEWAKDGQTGELYILQARPETIHTEASQTVYEEYRLQQDKAEIVTGMAVGNKIGGGRVRVIKQASGIDKFQAGEVLVTVMTDPDWEPIMKIASAIVTDKGGRTSHAAIVSRELGVPCVVGSEQATAKLKSGQTVTVDCSSGERGRVLNGRAKYTVIKHHLDKIPKTRTNIMVNIGSPGEAFKNHYLPVRGVGLGRLEFIIASEIQIHPNALINYKTLARDDNHHIKAIARRIDQLTAGYADKTDFYRQRLTDGIAKIGAAFWPNPVIIRFSDFKTNEYRQLLGGELYEPVEQNPMLGWRGASRYYDEKFKAAFSLECQALAQARIQLGLTNIIPMVPFCRTPEEGRQVVAAMKQSGLDRLRDKTLKIYVMCEIPSNIVLADDYLDVFDGMSIGSNDLTMLMLGLDRDSSVVAHVANENNPAVKQVIGQVIASCRRRKKYIGLCGQAPSDYPEFAEFLVKAGIASISLNPDSVIPSISRIKTAERHRLFKSAR